MGEAIRLLVGLDTNNDGRIVSAEPSNTITFPVLGVDPTEAEAAPFVGLLRDGQRKGEYDAAVMSLGVLAAEFNAASTANIDLVGLAEKGLGYIPTVSFSM